MKEWSVKPWVDVLKEYRDRGPEIAIEYCRAEEKFVLDANRDQLYLRGIDASGNSLGNYSPYTVQYKISVGAPYDRVTLKDEGDFHASFFVEYDGDRLTIYADDVKTASLVRRYGPDILGLNFSSMEELADRIQPRILEDFTEKMRA